MRPVMVLLAALSTPALCFGATAEFRVKDVPSATALEAARLEPGTVAFSDHRGDELTDPATGLIRFEDWARARPVQKQFLNLYPGYVEPTVNVTVHGVTSSVTTSCTCTWPRRASRWRSRRAASTSPAMQRLRSWKRSTRRSSTAPSRRRTPVPNKDPENPYNKRPDRRWCEGVARPSCIESRYQLEGKLPMGVRLANKLEEGDKKIAETVDFQSELRALSPQEIDQAGFAKLTGLDGAGDGRAGAEHVLRQPDHAFGSFRRCSSGIRPIPTRTSSPPSWRSA